MLLVQKKKKYASCSNEIKKKKYASCSPKYKHQINSFWCLCIINVHLMSKKTKLALQSITSQVYKEVHKPQKNKNHHILFPNPKTRQNINNQYNLKLSAVQHRTFNTNISMKKSKHMVVYKKTNIL